MRVVVTGSSGFIGRQLVPDLQQAGYDVVRLVRRQTEAENEYTWAPEDSELPLAALEGASAIINLAGRNISQGRWTDAVKRELRTSRINTTELLVRRCADLTRPPDTLISASATGIYGSRGDEKLTESSAPGYGFLADLARDWESAARRAEQVQMRVVLLRLGMVIGPGGGALQAMLLPFRLGLGGPIGKGRQWWPWIAMEDVLGSIRYALANTTVAGPLNLTSPRQVRCRRFTQTLGQVLRRPAFVPLPAIAARLMLGEMAGSLLLASTRVKPAALLDHGYEFQAPELGNAIRGAVS